MQCLKAHSVQEGDCKHCRYMMHSNTENGNDLNACLPSCCAEHNCAAEQPFDCLHWACKRERIAIHDCQKQCYDMKKKVFTLGSLYRRPAAQTCTSPERKLMRMHCAAEISWHFSMSILRSCTEPSTLISWLNIHKDVLADV